MIDNNYLHSTLNAFDNSKNVFIDELDVSVRTKNVLKRNGARTVNDIVLLGNYHDFRGFGKKVIREVDDVLEKYGLTYKNVLSINKERLDDFKIVYENDYILCVKRKLKDINKSNRDLIQKIEERQIKGQTLTYLFLDRTGLFKIGKTINLNNRFNNISITNPTLKIVGVLYGDYELFLHKMCRFRNVFGEWFLLTQEEIEYILNKEFDKLKVCVWPHKYDGVHPKIEDFTI